MGVFLAAVFGDTAGALADEAVGAVVHRVGGARNGGAGANVTGFPRVVNALFWLSWVVLTAVVNIVVHAAVLVKAGAAVAVGQAFVRAWAGIMVTRSTIGDTLVAYTYAAVAAEAAVVRTGSGGEANAHTVRGSPAFLIGATALVVVAGDTGDTNARWVAADARVTLVVSGASRDALSFVALTGGTLGVVVTLVGGEANAHVVRGGPAFLIGVAALLLVGVAGGADA